MLSWLTKWLRLRAAMFLAVAYAICVIAPPMALAFADRSIAAHCLFEDSSGAPHVHAQSASAQVVPHVHNAGAAHGHVDMSGSIKVGDETQGTAVGCCGLFSAPAISGNQNVLFADGAPELPASPALDDNLAGQGPDRLQRPPITL